MGGHTNVFIKMLKYASIWCSSVAITECHKTNEYNSDYLTCKLTPENAKKKYMQKLLNENPLYLLPE